MKLLSILIGPELFWVLIFSLVSLVVKGSAVAAPTLDRALENFFWIVPLPALATFAWWFFPGVYKSGLLLRVWIAGIVGAHSVLEKGLAAHSEQGPGIGAVYLLGMMLVFGALIAGSLFVKVRLA